MPLKASDLPSNAKKEILNQIRNQVGSDQYEQFVNKFGEDVLVDQVLEKIPSKTSPTRTTKTNIIRTRIKEIGRVGGLVMGFIYGLIVGGIFLGASWLLNTSLNVPFGHSLAALTNGAILTVPISFILAWYKTKELKSIDFRMVLIYYALGSLLGGIIGAGRWIYHIEDAAMAIIGPIWDNVFYSCYLPLFCVGSIISIIVWMVSGRYYGDGDDVFWPIIIFIFSLLAVISLIAILADAPLWGVFVPMINQNAVIVTLSFTAILGGLLGVIWPPKLLGNE